MNGVSPKRYDVILRGGVLWLESKKSNKIFWDIYSFRPDIKEEMEEGIIYKGRITFDEENLGNGEVVVFPRSISIGPDRKIFVNIR